VENDAVEEPAEADAEDRSGDRERTDTVRDASS